MKRFLSCVGTLLASAGFLFGQSPPEAVPSLPTDVTASHAAPAVVLPPLVSDPMGTPHLVDGPTCSAGECPCCCEPEKGPRAYIGSDYTMWWIRKGPLPVPLVSFNPNATPATFNPGALNVPGTSILIGNGASDGLHYPTLSGLRATAGVWLTADQSCGLEGSGFFLERRTLGFTAQSPGGTEVLGVPFFATVPSGAGLVNPAGETALNAGGGPMSVLVRSSTGLWGAEANSVFRVVNSERCYVAVLAGFRYLDLQENLQMMDFFPDTVTGGNGSLTITDAFTTRDQFYGGQLGTRLGFRCCNNKLTVEGTLKCALGTTHETVNILGQSSVTNSAFGFNTGITPAGVFAEPSNSGRRQRDVFSAVPEGQFQVSYNLARCVSLRAGYTFLYASDWVRPGNQIDRNINPTQQPLPTFGGTGGVLIGPAQPLPLFNRADFWAQGVNFGLEFKF